MMKKISRVENLESITTVMVRNLPVRCKQDELVQELNGSGFEGSYDFVYMPCNFASGTSRGFAFVNFTMPTVAPHFVNMWNGSQRFSDHSDSRALQVTAA